MKKKAIEILESLGRNPDVESAILYLKKGWKKQALGILYRITGNTKVDAAIREIEKDGRD